MKVNRAIQLLLMFLFVVNLSDGLFVPLFAVFVTDFIAGATLTTVGFSAALYAITKSIVQIPTARRLDRTEGEKDDYYVMIVGAIIGVLYTLGLTIISTATHLYLLAIFGGIGGAFLMASYYGVFARHVDKESQSFEWSIFSVGGLTVSTAVGGALGGVLVETFGFVPVMRVSAGLSAAAIVLIILLYPYLRKPLSEPTKQ